ncbi:hypothetical protein Hesp01_32730 [Herbidospora sp. NBRC 101105]|nr:hypothetical protein Hesp01_32730 [Herbidospora sp. NBRC 101105]
MIEVGGLLAGYLGYSRSSFQEAVDWGSHEAFGNGVSSHSSRKVDSTATSGPSEPNVRSHTMAPSSSAEAVATTWAPTA